MYNEPIIFLIYFLFGCYLIYKNNYLDTEILFNNAIL